MQEVEAICDDVIIINIAGKNDQTTHFGLAQQVRVQPFQREPFELVAQHDVYLHTCLIEGFGNSMIEALAVGVPVIATDCDFGPREIVMQGINGLLVPQHDVAAFARAMAEIKTLPMERLRMAARDSAQRSISSRSFSGVSRAWPRTL